MRVSVRGMVKRLLQCLHRDSEIKIVAAEVRESNAEAVRVIHEASDLITRIRQEDAAETRRLRHERR